MKRFHVHTFVADLQTSIDFYAQLFGVAPTRVEADYAKWMLDDPRLNFAISTHGGGQLGVNHLGLQVDSEEELSELRSRADQLQPLDEGETSCCYARSAKYWLTDPQGVAWEQFRTLHDIPTFGGAEPIRQAAPACCVPGTPAAPKSSCC